MPGVDPHLLFQLLLSFGHARYWLGVVLEPHPVFRSRTVFDRILDDDRFSGFLGFFFFGCVASISAPAAFPYPLDESYGGDGQEDHP